MKAAAGKHNCRSRNRDGERERESGVELSALLLLISALVLLRRSRSFVRSPAFFGKWRQGLICPGRREREENGRGIASCHERTASSQLGTN